MFPDGALTARSWPSAEKASWPNRDTLVGPWNWILRSSDMFHRMTPLSLRPARILPSGDNTRGPSLLAPEGHVPMACKVEPSQTRTMPSRAELVKSLFPSAEKRMALGCSPSWFGATTTWVEIRFQRRWVRSMLEDARREPSGEKA